MAASRMDEGFGPIIDRFTAGADAAFAARLAAAAQDWDAEESALIRATAAQALYANARLKLNRVLVLELHAARHSGERPAAMRRS